MISRLRFAVLAGFLAAALAPTAVLAAPAAPVPPPTGPAVAPAAPAPVPSAPAGVEPPSAAGAGQPGADGFVSPEAIPEGIPSVAPYYLPDRSVGDSLRAASDHDFVIGRWGVEGRDLNSAPFNCGTAAAPVQCRLNIASVGVRRWMTRNVGYSLGLAFGLGGGSDRDPASGTWRTRDTFVQIGPTAGLQFLLGNWRHLAILASPQLAFVIFTPSQATSTQAATDGFLVDLRAQLEAELHFGFLGLPALAVSVTAGMVFQFTAVSDHRDWSLDTFHPGSISSIVENLFVRYYF